MLSLVYIVNEVVHIKLHSIYANFFVHHEQALPWLEINAMVACRSDNFSSEYWLVCLHCLYELVNLKKLKYNPWVMQVTRYTFSRRSHRLSNAAHVAPDILITIV